MCRDTLTWSKNSNASLADTEASVDAESGGRATSTSSSSDEVEEKERIETEERSEAGEDFPEVLFQMAAMLLPDCYFHSDLQESPVYLRKLYGCGQQCLLQTQLQ